MQSQRQVCDLDWITTARRPKEPSVDSGSLSLVDLFCGCGGISLGVWEAARRVAKRLDVRLALDISTDALDVYRQNFNVDSLVARNTDILNVLTGDIGQTATRLESELQKHVGNLDLLVAGPPCQGHSDLNNVTRRNDPRNQLYLKVIRAAELFAPSVMIVENVPTVIHDRSGVVYDSERMLQELGYTVCTTVVDASELGLPQVRKRHILIATQSPFNFQSCIKALSIHKSNLCDYLSGIEDEPLFKKGVFYQPSRMTQVNRERVDFLFEHNLHDLPNDLRPPCHRNKSHSYKSMYGRLHWDLPAQTITSGFGSIGQGRFVHPTRRRTITPHEAARIQGFPDFFSFDKVTKRTRLHEMIGNAVPPVVSAVIISMLLEKGRL